MPDTPPTSAPAPAVPQTLVWLLFLLSGACGLIYEVLWCRHLGLIFGNTVQSLSAVLTAFMAGLALGSYVGGRLGHRLRRPLMVYGLLELLIGLYCAALPWFFADNGPIVPFYRSLYGEEGSRALPFVRFGISFLLLLIPTTFMGATLPVLSQFLTRSQSMLGRTAGALYAVNTFGAVVGAAGTGFFLLPALGKGGTNWLAVGCNIALGLTAIAFGRRCVVASAPAAAAGAAETAPAAEAPCSPRAVRAAVVTFGITGFAAMATQIAWTRALSLGTGSSTYAFSLIVAIFILGLGLGGAWAARVAPRARDPVAFLAKVLALAGLSCLVVSVVLGYGPLLFFAILVEAQGWSWGALLLAEAAGIAVMLLVPTFLMGATMPLTLQVGARTYASASRTVGTIYAVNTMGAILGSLCGGLLLLPWLWLQCTLESMALLYAAPGLLLFALSAGRRDRRAITAMAAIILPCLAVVLLRPAWNPQVMAGGLYLLREPNAVEAVKQWRFGDVVRELESTREMLFYDEGLAATVSVGRQGGQLGLRIGGKPEASSSTDMNNQIMLTLLPEVLHKRPEKVLVIGLGSGVSAGSALVLDSVQQVDVVEMSPEVVAASWWFRDVNGLTYVEDRLETPRLRLLINDGRNHLLLTSRSYDVIASEPSNPWMAGVANLFTKEAFQLSRARLNKGGVMCQWLHSYSLEESDFLSVVRTFAEVFPHVQLWRNACTDFLLIGSEEPLELPVERLREALRQPAVRRLVEQVHLDTEYEFAANYAAGEKTLRRVAGQEVLQTDDNLKLEFSAPRALYRPTRAFRSLRFPSQPERVLQLGSLPPAERAEAIRGVDLAAAAREHTHFAWESIGSADTHHDIAYKLAPRQFWALDHRQDSEIRRAVELLKGVRVTEPPVDTAGAVQILKGLHATSKYTVAIAASALNEALLQHAAYLIGAGDADGALAALDEVKDPAHAAQAALLRARAVALKKEYPRALAQVETAAKAGAGKPACVEATVAVLRQAGQTAEALAKIEEFLKAPQGSGLDAASAARLYSLRAELLLERNEPQAALAAAQLARRLDPSLAQYLRVEAEAQTRLAKFAEAADAWRWVAALQVKDPAPRRKLAEVLLRAADAVSASAVDGDAAAVDLLRLARRVSREITILEPEGTDGWELACASFLALAKRVPADAALWRQEAAAAYQKALALHKGDASKLRAEVRDALK